MSDIIAAIDVHAHYGDRVRPGPVQTNRFMSGSADEVARRAGLAHIRLTLVSPLAALMPRGSGKPEQANIEAAKTVADLPALRQWVVVDPRNPKTFDQARDMLSLPHCIGIKIHPEEHEYPIAEHGRKVFEFASRHRAVVMTHSGHERSVPADFVSFADDFPEVSLILAHLGNGVDGDRTQQVRAIQAGRHDNLFTDTSSAMSITPNLIEWAVAEIGAERILFGTDSPLYFAAMQRARIDYAEIGEQDKRRILHDNAAALFGMR